jgi:hypothetical protein
MTSRRPLLIVVFALPHVLLALPTQAQEADTSATDTSDVAAPPPDTTQTLPEDTTTTEPSDTTQAAADADTTDGMAPSDNMATAADSVTTAADSASAPTDTVATAADSIAVSLPPSSEGERARAVKEAQGAAASWLSFTDAGQFGESWDAADSTLKEKISREAWVKQGAQARSRLDSLLFRTLTRLQYRDSTAQLPTRGPTVALQYRSEFEGGSVLEAVITTKQDDAWKVAGYRIVPAPPSAQASDSTATDADSTAQQ